MISNYHTHTFRCNHASGKDEDYVIHAINAGIKTLGFSDHTPRIFKSGHVSGFRVSVEMAKDYFDSIKSLKEKYKEKIDIKIGAEAEYYINDEDYFSYIDSFGVDYLIQGQHFILTEESGRGSARATSNEQDLADYYYCLYRASETKRFAYIAHPDMLNFTGDEKIYVKHTEEFLKYAKANDVLIEINRLGFYEKRHYPRELFWQMAGDVGCRAIIGLDAHSPFVFDDEETVDRITDYAKRFNIELVKELKI